jgi:hypothetical protein
MRGRIECFVWFFATATAGRASGREEEQSPVRMGEDEGDEYSNGSGVAAAVSRQFCAGPRRGLMPGPTRVSELLENPARAVRADRAGGVVVDVIRGGPWTAHCRARHITDGLIHNCKIQYDSMVISLSR